MRDHEQPGQVGSWTDRQAGRCDLDGQAGSWTDRQADDTFRDDSVADSQDSEELLEDSRVSLLLPGAPHQP